MVYSPERIFTGEEWLNDHAVVVENEQIVAIVPQSSLTSSQQVQSFSGCTLAPAFIDLQIYGAGGKLLAVYPETDSLTRLNDYCRSGGAVYCMPTVATNPYDVFYKSIDAIKEYWKQGGKGVLGLHIEGPWINPVRRGAHIEELIHSPSLQQVKDLLEYGKGVIRIITLAPEVCSNEVIEYIISQGIIISAGHSNASFEEAKKGFDKGIPIVTHLYNAMSPLQHRAPGLAGAAMDDERAMASIIPDGYHVSFPAIRIAKKAMGERLFVITDAVTETSQGYYPHTLAGDKYEASGILSGSALTMSKSVYNLVHHCNIELGEALRMCSLYPARVMKMEDKFGRIAKGYDAKMVVLTDSLQVDKLIG